MILFTYIQIKMEVNKMAGKPKDISNQVFGWLTALRRLEEKKGS